VAGKVVAIKGSSVAGYNATYLVKAPITATTFAITAASGLGSATGGTATPVCPTCSMPNVLPWTNITYPQAEAACEAVGAEVCTEVQWHRACGVVNSPTYPITYAGSGTLIVEAEDYQTTVAAPDTSTPAVYHSWVEDYTPQYQGISALQASPDVGLSLTA